MRHSILFILGILLLIPSVSGAVSCIDLDRTLSLNMKGDDVAKLQEFLRDNAAYTGKIGGNFGRLTEAAVKRWQQGKGITATGAVGPLTRNAMRCSAQKQTSNSSQKAGIATKNSSPGTLSRGAKGPDVSELQRFLIQQGYLAAGNDSGFFDAATEMAVQKWQSSHGLVSQGSPETTGYGAVGPRTKAAIAAARAKGNTSSSSPSLSGSSQPYTQSEAIALIRKRIMPSVVQIRCTDRDGGEESAIGSGVYTFDPAANKPIVFTNAHVVLGSDGKFHGCNVYFPIASNGSFSFYDSVYSAMEATLYHNVESRIDGEIVNGIDSAVLTLTAPGVDAQGLQFPFPPKQEDAIKAIIELCRKTDPINIGDAIYNIGYPGVGGSSLTLSQGVVSGFLGRFNEKIKVSAGTFSGNSGGIAIGQDNICEYGIPTSGITDARVGGNIGFLLSSAFINTFTENMTGNLTYSPPDIASDPNTYLTRTYAFPGFSMSYPELWTISQVAPDADGDWAVRFSPPSEGVLDAFTESINVTILPNSTQDDLAKEIAYFKNLAVTQDPTAIEGTVILGGRVQADNIFYSDTTSGREVLTRFTIFLENGHIYTISVRISPDSPNYMKYGRVSNNMLKLIKFNILAQIRQILQTANALTAFESFFKALQNGLKTKLVEY